MKAPVAAIAAGLALVAGQVAAQSQPAAPAVTDRLGSSAAAGETAVSGTAGLIFGLAFVAGFSGLMIASDDESESD